ncbi:MAG: hypothetical protein H7138_17360 [Myxococcales bacterium]|nr:hypothetical protein [Myxococcales bacterium]
MSRSMVVIELPGNAPLPRDLAAGGVFVPDCELRLAEECDLVVCGVSHQLMIPARVVYVDPRGGAGLELLGFSPEMMAQLAELASPVAGAARVATPLPGLDDSADGSATDLAVAGEPSGRDDERDDERDDDSVFDDDDDLAIPVASDDEIAGARATGASGVEAAPGSSTAFSASTASSASIGLMTEPSGLAGEPVFSYVRPGLAYRGGVARRAEAEADFAGALGADLDAELGLGDLADVEPADGDEPDPASDAGLDLDLLDLPAVGDAGLGDPEAYASADAGDGNDSDGSDDSDTSDGGDDGDASDGDAARPRGSTRRFPRNVNERLGGLPLALQIKMATQGELHERIVLERLYGKNVWETLLRNPRLTAPEVSKIARYGSLPRILLEIIVGNNAWLQIPEVRRALLSNPRLGVDQIMKVLRLTPKHELRLAAIQTAYPHAVRNAAKMMMRGES